VRVPHFPIRRIAAFTCGFALVATCAVAGPKRQAPPLNPYLSWPEQSCRAYGMFIYHRGIDRDRGMSLTDALATARQWDQEHDAAATIRQAHSEMIYALYQLPHLTPTQMRNNWETNCLTQQTPAPGQQPRTNQNTDLKYRY
jgi:hypothetical protein